MRKAPGRCGVDVVSDGEQGRDGYATYVRDRLTGFEGEDRVPVTSAYGSRKTSRRPVGNRPAFLTRPACNGPIEWRDFPAVQRDIENLKAAVEHRRQVRLHDVGVARRRPALPG